ncbi:MAG: DUF418 domain-containing protein [Acidimicrobiales bacterium]
MAAQQLSGPLVPSQRIDALDIVRGFALFGVLMLNMLDFAGPVASADPWAVSVAWWDRAAELAIRVLGEAAFYTVFSFLFGLGFALQFERALGRGERFTWRFVSRLSVLAVFGLAHGFLIWNGDILFQYSMAGAFLLLFARVTSQAAPRWALGFAVFTLSVASLLFGVAMLSEFEPETAANAASEISFYSQSGFGTIASDHLDGWVEHVLVTAAGIPWFLALFLVGLWAVRSGKLANWRNERPFLLSVLRVSIPVAIVAKGGLALFIIFGLDAYAVSAGLVLSVFVGGPALGATYVCLLLLALRRVADGSHVLRHLAPVGRMALTNYLMQSIAAVLFFYGYGLGYYGRFGVATTLGFTVLFFAAQMVFSRLWLSRFEFGPMEWVWRMLTYRAPIGSAAGSHTTSPVGPPAPSHAPSAAGSSAAVAGSSAAVAVGPAFIAGPLGSRAASGGVGKQG